MQLDGILTTGKPASPKIIEDLRQVITTLSQSQLRDLIQELTLIKKQA